MYRVRKGTSKDVALIHNLVQQLATFEKLRHEVKCTKVSLKKRLFSRRPVAFTLIIEIKEQRTFVPAGFALYFYNFSTFLGLPGIYLEDLFVLPQYRSKGLGRILLKELSKIAVREKCGRLEWAVLDWNKRAINFYKTLGSKPMSEWTVHRLGGKNLKRLAKK